MKTLCLSGRVPLLLLVAQVLWGCSAYSPRDLANPTQIHQTLPTPANREADEEEKSAIAAAPVVAKRYYAALEKAKGSAGQQDIDAYVKEGTALVELYCVRWFGRIEDAQRSLQLTDNNRNVVTQLGTTAIGLARLHSDATAVYGAITTAVTGFNANLNSAFLVAPNAANVKRLTLEALRSRARLLRDASSALYPTTFSDAYLELEKLAEQCTHAEVKRLTTKSVDQSGASADPSSGDPVVFSVATIAQATTLKQRVEALIGKVDSLSGPDALMLARVMPFQKVPEVVDHLKLVDPSSKRISDDKVAKAILKALVVLTGKSESAVVDWETRIALLGQ